MAIDEGRVVFVRGVVPGDVVEVELTERAARWARGRLVRLVTPSPERVAPPCPVQARCGGCPWMIGSREAQRASRAAILAGEVDKRLGRGRGVEVVMADDEGPALGYRQRVRLTWQGGALGYLQKGSHTLVDIGDGCTIADPRIGAALPTLREELRARGGSGRVTLLAGDEGVAGWIEPRGGEGEVWARAEVTVRVGAYRQVLSARSFAQANAAVTAAIITHITTILRAEPPGRVAELFAGSGTLTQAIWAAGHEVVAYEIDGAARAAFEATRRACDGRGSWHACDLASGVVLPAPGPVDVVLLDPPRTGAAAVMPWVRASAARLVIYVACDLATGLRDLATLVEGDRWRVERVVGFDMFPHSGHQEVLAIARRAL
ncbi:MAG: class I SAM-dependent RNA methyltransferase [Deltaproteobacteria bacterium]|nr:class I SAM-dependent RNA methyltransferase [Deltaproteobacteria bacterium]